MTKVKAITDLARALMIASARVYAPALHQVPTQSFVQILLPRHRPTLHHRVSRPPLLLRASAARVPLSPAASTPYNLRTASVCIPFNVMTGSSTCRLPRALPQTRRLPSSRSGCSLWVSKRCMSSEVSHAPHCLWPNITICGTLLNITCTETYILIDG